MRLIRAAVLMLGLVLGAPAPAGAVVIDDFTDPGILAAGGGPVSVNTDSFTTQGPEPVLASGTCPARSFTAWWSIRGNGLPITVETTTATFDTIIAAYDSGAVTNAARLACDDQPGNPARITFASERGRAYLVQVGGKNNSHGFVALKFTVNRPGNDDRANPLAVGTGATAAVDQTGATLEDDPATPFIDEVHACGASPYAGTVWFRYSAPEAIDARFSAAADFPAVANRSDTVMAIYRSFDTAPLACNDDAGAAFGSSALSLRLAPGDYLVQVGARGEDNPALGTGAVSLTVLDRDRDRDGALEPADCDDGNPALRPGAIDVPEDGIDQDCANGDAVDLDRDRDGFTRPGDCRDDRPDINPGRVDIPGDAIDQDCKGGPAPFTRLAAGISGFFSVFASHSKVTALSVRNAPAGARITMTCTPKGKKGCPRKRFRRTLKKARARVNLAGSLRKAKLRPGVRLRITVTQPGFLGAVTTWRIRARKLPARTDRCLTPGAKKPRRCPR